MKILLEYIVGITLLMLFGALVVYPTLMFLSPVLEVIFDILGVIIKIALGLFVIWLILYFWE